MSKHDILPHLEVNGRGLPFFACGARTRAGRVKAHVATLLWKSNAISMVA